MKLQTQIPLKQQQFNQIDYNSKILLLGSCFSKNINEKFKYFKFQTTANPFGILFHPLAIEKLITNAINEKEYTQDDIFFLNEQWHCFDANSKLSTSSKESFIDSLNAQITNTNKHICESTHIIITIGTAWMYRLIENDKVVANCHKVPQKKFLKELLSVNAIVESLAAIIELVKMVNSTANFVFTVSPIRHVKDGFIENMQSKSHIITAIHELLHQKPSIKNGQLSYFPSYEIMMDELRDYRFYEQDMIHPNTTAIEYIWNRFAEVWISPKAYQTMQAVDEVQKGLRHRPFNKNSKEYRAFLKNLEQKKQVLYSKFNHISF